VSSERDRLSAGGCGRPNCSGFIGSNSRPSPPASTDNQSNGLPKPNSAVEKATDAPDVGLSALAEALELLG
jgi:hypothetical protein